MRINYIVTGASGFIGKYLINFLKFFENNQENPYLIHAIDINPYSKEEIKENPTNIKFYKSDINNPGESTALILDQILSTLNEEELKNTVIYHFASTVGPTKITPEASKFDFELNFGIYQVLKKYTINRFYFTSSSEIYGEQDIFDENGSLVINSGPDTSFRKQYALQKISAENLFLTHFRSTNQGECIILRLFNIVGCGQKPGFVISNFNEIQKYNLDILKNLDDILETSSDTEEIEEILNRFKKFPIHNSGDQSRTFTSIYDLIKVFQSLEIFRKNPKKLKSKNNEIINNIINIANIKNNYSINQVSNKYIDIFKKIVEGAKEILLQKEKETIELSEKDYKKLEFYNTLLKIDNEFFIERIEVDPELVNQKIRNPLVYKLYKVLKYEPEISLENIILDCMDL